jgi:hypothetical protein
MGNSKLGENPDDRLCLRLDHVIPYPRDTRGMTWPSMGNSKLGDLSDDRLCPRLDNAIVHVQLLLYCAPRTYKDRFNTAVTVRRT